MPIENKYSAILEAGLELFVAYGFHGSPTSRIAERAGVSNGTLFNHFFNKDRLIVEIYKNARWKMFESRKEGIEKIAGFRGMIKQVWKNNVDWALQNPKMYHYIHQFELSPYLEQFRWENSTENNLAPIFAQAIQKELIIALPGELHISMLEKQLFSLITYLEKNPNERTNEKLKNEVFESYWQSIRKR